MAENSQLGFRYAPAKLSSKYEFTQKFGLDSLVRFLHNYLSLNLQNYRYDPGFPPGFFI